MTMSERFRLSYYFPCLQIRCHPVEEAREVIGVEGRRALGFFASSIRTGPSNYHLLASRVYGDLMLLRMQCR